MALRSGTLRLALGLASRADRTRVRVTCDQLRVAIEYRDRTRVEHALGNVLVVGRGIRPAIWIATNSGWWRRRHIVPRAHPNDGFVDVLEIHREMPWPQRMRAYVRALRADHLPHPSMRVVRGERYAIEGHGPYSVWTDGSYAGRADRVHVEVIPDALEVHA